MNASALACLLVFARVAHAQPVDAIELRVTADARGCITEAALRTRLASLRVRVMDSDDLAFAVDASSEPAQVEVRRNDRVIATRRFDTLPERCADRLQTVALVLALAIEHAGTPDYEEHDVDAPVQREVETGAPAVEPAAAPEPSAPEAEPAKAAAVEGDDRDAEWREPPLRVIAGVGAGYGLLPEIAGMLAVGVELPSPALRIGLGALVTSEASTGLAGGTVLTRLSGARAYGCATGAAWSLDLHGCAGVALGVVSGRGRDYAPAADATGTWLAPLMRLGARYPARGVFSAGLALEGLVNLVRPELKVSGNGGGTSSVALFGASLSIEATLAVP